jgi:hypothetical protein
VGFFARALGIPDNKLADVDLLRSWHRFPGQERRNWISREGHITSAASEIYNLNDALTISDEVRKQKLRRAFRAMGHTIRFRE